MRRPAPVINQVKPVAISASTIGSLIFINVSIETTPILVFIISYFRYTFKIKNYYLNFVVIYVVYKRTIKQKTQITDIPVGTRLFVFGEMEY